MNAKPSVVRGLVFAAVYAAAVAVAQAAANGVLPFHVVDLYPVGVGIAAYFYGWLPALALFLMSVGVSGLLFPGQEGALRFGSGADAARLAIYTAANLVVIVGFHRLQRAVASLRRTEESYRLLAESAVDGILVFDGRLMLVEANPAACGLLGLSREELLGRPLRSLFPPDRCAWLENAIGELDRGRAVVHEYELTRGGAGEFVGEVTANRTRDGRILAVIRDITGRKQVELALLNSEARFRRFFEATSEGIVIHEEGAILDVNQALAEMLGYDAGELSGRRVWEFAAPETRDRVREAAIEGREGLYEAAFLRKDGRAVPVEIQGKPIPYEGKRASVAAVRDLTERRRFEDRLREAQKMEAIGRLAGGVAHDFNNLLTIITGYAFMLYDGLPSGGSLRGCAEEIITATQRAAGLSAQLLAFSRKQAMQPRVVDLNALVAGMEKLIRRVVPEHVEVALDLDAELGSIKADPTQIEQVIMNLVLNARDAMPHGGRLIIRTARALHAAEDAPEREGEYALLAVTDTGIGMDTEVKSHIFEPFYTTKEKGRGTGLGLATTYGIVKQHGGDIRVWSEPGRGARFEIYLERSTERPEYAAAPASAAPRRGTETVLLAEDEAAVRRMMRDVLEKRGHTVLEAATPAEALAIAQEYAGAIDLLLTDVIMPQMSGRQLAEAFKAARPSTRVLFISGYASSEIAKEAPESSISFLSKPFTPEALMRKVREVLDA